MRKFYFILFMTIATGCNNSPQKSLSENCENTSYPRHVDNIILEDSLKIKRLDGRFVLAEGILHYSFEDVAVYPMNNGSINSALWLEPLNIIAESTLTHLNG